MANQLKMANIQAIQSLHAQGWSQRAIARQLGINRETVARYVRPPLGGSNPAKMHAGPGASLEDPRNSPNPRKRFHQHQPFARAAATGGGRRLKPNAWPGSPRSGFTRTS